MKYMEWADELLQSLVEKYDNPYSEYCYDDCVKLLAEKLESDCKDWLVPEQFCSDCDHQRRCNQ